MHVASHGDAVQMAKVIKKMWGIYEDSRARTPTPSCGEQRLEEEVNDTRALPGKVNRAGNLQIGRTIRGVSDSSVRSMGC